MVSRSGMLQVATWSLYHCTCLAWVKGAALLCHASVEFTAISMSNPSPFCWAPVVLAVVNLFSPPSFCLKSVYHLFSVTFCDRSCVNGCVGKTSSRDWTGSHQKWVGVGGVSSYFPKASSPREARHAASCLPTSRLALLQDGYRSLNKTVWNKAGVSSLVRSPRCLEATLIRFTRELWNLLEVRGCSTFNPWDAQLNCAKTINCGYAQNYPLLQIQILYIGFC